MRSCSATDRQTLSDGCHTQQCHTDHHPAGPNDELLGQVMDELLERIDRGEQPTLSASERLAWGEFWANVAVVVGQIKATIGRGTP